MAIALYEQFPLENLMFMKQKLSGNVQRARDLDNRKRTRASITEGVVNKYQQGFDTSDLTVIQPP